MKKYLTLALALIIAVVLIILLMPNEKKKLTRDIRALEQAVEHKNKTLAFNYISASYDDPKGLNYDGLMQIIENMFSYSSSIEINLSNLKPSIDSTGPSRVIFASCSLGLRVFAVVDSQKVLLYGGVIQPSPVRAYFKKITGKYELYSAEY
ncbi:MAG TPA: hypothetical protein VF399_08610 [bacterium]|jgi:hypothetical protein